MLPFWSTTWHGTKKCSLSLGVVNKILSEDFTETMYIVIKFESGNLIGWVVGIILGWDVFRFIFKTQR